MRTYFIVAFALASAANGYQIASMMHLREARRLRVIMEHGQRPWDIDVKARFKQAAARLGLAIDEDGRSDH